MDITKNKQKWINELIELLKIPSISSQSEHKEDMRKAAKWVESKLEEIGFKASVLKTTFNPVVYAENLAAGIDKPTILIYGHYDVQAEGDLSEWASSPFIPEIRSNNIYARGTADDKGQLFTWIAAVETLLKEEKRLPVNIKFLIEGAEEEGSRGLDEFVADNTALLKADTCVISDSHSLSETQPLICYGLRGLTYMEMKVSALSSDVHSGIYGGNVINPLNVLAQMISKLKDENGKILIPGFYDNARKVSQEEQDELSLFPMSEDDIKKETGAKGIFGEKDFGIAARAGARPTLDVNGIWGGYQGEGAKTIIPGSAGAKISMRLVPFQSSHEIEEKFTKFVKLIAPNEVDVEVKALNHSEPVIFEKNNKFFKAAEEAFTEVFGTKPLYELSGGSIGVTVSFKNLLGLDSVLLGYGLPDDNLHGPNEKLSLSMFEKGIKTNIEFLKKLA
jgi:acetylornithine deacetylase/succinyl-diaminopimelate desuccinylase-like protein